MGRSSTEMDAVDVRDGAGRTVRLALRRYVDVVRLSTDPWYRPPQEAQALRIVADAGVPAPRLIADDVEARHGVTPALLETRIGGRPIQRRPAQFDRYLKEAADVLHAIHAIDQVSMAALPPYAPYWPPSALRIPPWSSRPQMWIRALEVLAGLPPRADVGFVHRDYHPGNILVRRGEIAGVVDWLTACRGPRSIDLARMRLNLAADFGLEAASRFLALYRANGSPGWEHDPYWDLLDAVDMAHDSSQPTTRAEAQAWDRFEQWVGAALADVRP
jgi:aminoglycoside phosphotransferase (APT) family kinase protein